MGLAAVRDRAPVRAPVCGLGLEPGVFLLLAVAVRDRLESPWTPRSRGLAVSIGLPAPSPSSLLPPPPPPPSLLCPPIRFRGSCSSLTAAAPSTLTLKLLQFIRLVCARVCALFRCIGQMEDYHKPDQQTLQALKNIATRLRINSIKATTAAGSG